MSNRLEQEFPHTSWRAIPPVGPRGRDQEVRRRPIARGHELRHPIAAAPIAALRRPITRGHELRRRAVRSTARGVIAAAARGFVAVAGFVRRRGHDLTEPPQERGRWAGPAHGA
jgi:hypothetical protein